MATGLYIAVDFKPRLGGIAEHTHQMAKHLTELGERITVLTPSLPGSAEFDKTCNYPVVRFTTKLERGGGWKRPLDRSRILIEIIKVAQRRNADYLMLDRWSPIAGASMILASRLLNIPFFLFAHGSEFSQPIPLRFSRKITVRAATRVICVSSYIRSLALADGVKPSRVVTIPNGFDSREIESYRSRNYEGRFPRVEAACPAGTPTVLTVSRLMSRKGVDRVIEAMPRIVSEVPGTRYIIVGDGGDGERLNQLASASPSGNSITFLGPLTGDEKFECYACCDVFVLPSEVEGFGIVFLEANAFGKPVVAGRIGGVPEAVVHETTGLLVDPDNIGEIVQAITRLLKDPAEARRLGNNGRRRVKNDLNWKVSASKLLSVIHAALEEKK